MQCHGKEYNAHMNNGNGALLSSIRCSRAITDFQRRVYLAVSYVPIGRVTTYKAVAKRIGCGSSQAVGQALKNNPFAPAVPCHRVIASDLTAGGFQGKRRGAALVRKLELLAGEGVSFKQGRLADRKTLYTFKSR
jgi:methylated-DNA-[protein]-cysteine S-methyltransferase